ncbi:MAG: FtsX-like permease family protein [Bacteroidales bacterium]|jgi:putative ABC transport system permease protein|nr:FtsX-like permease family protein [Bacteroidales bacterium]
MIRFLLKGILRDRSRSLLPIIVVSLGVMITVFLQAYMDGVLGDSIEWTAQFTTGHVKVMTRAYQENMSQTPNDYALTDVDILQPQLEKDYPGLSWAPRIQFGGLLDVPDENGLTRAQGNVKGMGLELLNSSEEIERMHLNDYLSSGDFPQQAGEILLSRELFNQMGLTLGDEVTLISSGMWGDMAMYNFKVCGTLQFGINSLDRGFMIADIEDLRLALNMENSASEILGFLKEGYYINKEAQNLSGSFNQKQTKTQDKFSLLMLPLSDMNGMQFFVAYAQQMQYLIVLVFVMAMSLVLWNAGLLGGLRRYGEFGLRLAIGENKHELYRSLMGEAVMIGLLGSIIGVAFGLLFSWLMQKYGLDVGDMLKDSTIMMPTVMRARITSTTYYIGFLPGILSTLIGAMLSGIGIYKRQTASLFKELEN